MRSAKKYQGSFQLVTHCWGEHVTADYIVSGTRKDGSTGMISCTGDRHALVMMDVHTRMRAFYPVPAKDTANTYDSVLHFAGGYEAKDTTSPDSTLMEERRCEQP